MWSWDIAATKRIIYVTFQRKDKTFGTKHYAYLLEGNPMEMIDPDGDIIRVTGLGTLRVETEEKVFVVPPVVTKKIYKDGFGRITSGPIRFTL